MVAHLGIEIDYIQAENFWLLDDPIAFRPSLETPFLAWESIARHVLDRFRRQGVQVLLTGHGGDRVVTGSALTYADRLSRGKISVLCEVANHARYREVPYHRLLYKYVIKPLLPDVALRTLCRLRNQERSQIPSWISNDFTRRTGLVERLACSSVPRRFRSLARQENYEITFRPFVHDTYWYDRIAPCFGLEARHPFLDRRLAEFLLSVPSAQLFWAGRYKWLLRRAMNGILPDVVRLRRDKTYFGSYMDLGLREKEVIQIGALLEAPMIGELDIVNGHRLLVAYKEYCTGKKDITVDYLWYSITLELWLRQYYEIMKVRSCRNVTLSDLLPTS